MVFEGFEPIFGEPKVDWAKRGPLPLRGFVYYVHSPDPSHLRVHVSDFHTNTWEAVRSVHQLEDMVSCVPLFHRVFFFFYFVVTLLGKQGGRDSVILNPREDVVVMLEEL